MVDDNWIKTSTYVDVVIDAGSGTIYDIYGLICNECLDEIIECEQCKEKFDVKENTEVYCYSPVHFCQKCGEN